MGSAAAAGIGLSAAPALASPNYPGLINDIETTDCPTETRCLICHTSAAGGEGTAIRPFAVTLRGLGLTQGKSGRQLSTALRALPEDVDSDADGFSDLDELVACGNPSGEELGPGPGFGCNAQLAPRSPQSDVAAWAAAAITLFGLLGLGIGRRRLASGR